MSTWINLPPSGGGSGSDYWKNAAADFASLPAGTTEGEVRMTLDTNQLYYWDGAAWQLVPTSAIDPADVADTDSIDLTVALGVLSGAVRLSADAASANNILATLSIQSGASPGLRAQVANSLVRGLLSSANNAISYDNTTGTFTFNVGNVDHAALSNLLADAHTQYALLAGRSGGQTIVGGTASGDDLTLASTAHGTKGSVIVSDPLKLPVRTTVEINALTPEEGLVVFDSTLHRPVIYIADTTNAWVPFLGWGE